MKTVRTYQNINDALLDQSWLESSGIESFIPDEVTASSSLPHLSVYSGIRLQVDEADYEEALKLLPEQVAPNPPEGVKEKKKEEKIEGTRSISLGAFRGLVGVDVGIYLLALVLSFSHIDRVPESILNYAADQYISYPLALLNYQLYWPMTVILFIPKVGLFFLKRWARPAYITAWGLGMFQVLFSPAYFTYPNAAFLASLSTLIGGFVCCTIYFTQAANYFEKKGAIKAE